MNDTVKLRQIYEQLSTPEEKILDLLEKIDREPLRGDDGHTPTEEELIELIKPLIPEPQKGKNGKTPSKEEIIALILPLIPEPRPGADGSPDTPEEVRDKISSLKGEKRLSVFSLKDTEWLKGKEKEIQWSSAGFKIYTDSTLTGDGTYGNPLHAVASSVGTPITEEAVSTVGTTFTLLHTPIANTLRLYRGGSRITQVNGDFTYTSGTSGTLAAALSVGETLTADYNY